MSPFFANQSCDSFQPEARPCLLGNYVDYAVNLSTSNAPNEVAATLRFAQSKKIRFVVRNTGHEYVVSFLLSISIGEADSTISVTLGNQPELELCQSGLIISSKLNSFTGLMKTTVGRQSKWELVFKAMKQWQPRKLKG